MVKFINVLQILKNKSCKCFIQHTNPYYKSTTSCFFSKVFIAMQHFGAATFLDCEKSKKQTRWTVRTIHYGWRMSGVSTFVKFIRGNQCKSVANILFPGSIEQRNFAKKTRCCRLVVRMNTDLYVG